ncbi:hypothetical protein OESDEN_08264 [Oesophagostomum dentatum]|uniref:Uncharacterized protein n=1 Tax=Oesophagostomum dentatum TaxID=61180 RepID=A0A0B1T7S0_OESDE|nr:hypothetical protein OESDEN_08264 [Oesophagostomum dentatum]
MKFSRHFSAVTVTDSTMIARKNLNAVNATLLFAQHYTDNRKQCSLVSVAVSQARHTLPPVNQDPEVQAKAGFLIWFSFPRNRGKATSRSVLTPK